MRTLILTLFIPRIQDKKAFFMGDLRLSIPPLLKLWSYLELLDVCYTH
jgi:hypothetical protein